MTRIQWADWLTAAERDLLLRGIATVPFVTNPARALAELLSRAANDPDCGVFTMPGAFVILDNNRSEFVNACTVVHIYRESGSRKDWLHMLATVRDFAKAGGMSRVHGVDINAKPGAYCRLFRIGRAYPREVGRFYEFNVGEGSV